MKEIEIIYEDGVFKPLEKVVIEVKDISHRTHFRTFM
ncbi:MAG: protein belonging to Uncharacterized protein family UPF0165 [Candidatus Syntrophoarchaeum caldarius]|uniref:Antitoxin n=1 Tax=Candidatus Syntropharchaeum caldarium TaxID=1838285 RepID=A0A1F2PAL3_9EURY|nr:MAG: protein belonging to Uncharacterized protein family UPF0165 [Candidatus Syntrophoarchaeum caldarius]